MEQSKQHIQLPNDMTVTKELDPKDLLIYVCIKKFMDKKTKTCYPSLDTIVDLSGVSKPTVRKSIEKLKELKYIEVFKEGRKNKYKFNSYKNFEPFSYDFLMKNDLTPGEKALIIASQQYMFKDVEGFGKITYSNLELSDKINMSYNTIVKYSKSLKDKGYLDIIKTNKKDSQSGIFVQEKLFHLDALGQAIVFTLQNHEERIENIESNTDLIKRQMQILINENRELKNRLNRLEENNQEIEL